MQAITTIGLDIAKSVFQVLTVSMRVVTSSFLAVAFIYLRCNKRLDAYTINLSASARTLIICPGSRPAA